MAMETAFYKIISGSCYNLLWQPNYILNDIINTYNIYGSDGVNDKDFDKMIAIITLHGNRAYIVNGRNKCGDIILKLCELFFEKLTPKNMDKLLKCISINKMEQNYLELISQTQYIFTESQIKLLNNLGYITHEFTHSLSYEQLLLLFNNSLFMNNFKKDIYISYDLSATPIDEIITLLKNLCEKYKIAIETHFEFPLKLISLLITTDVQTNTVMIYNIHIIANNLNIKFKRSILIEIMDNYLLCKTNSPTNINNVILDYKKIRQIINNYDQDIIDRDFVLQRIMNNNYAFIIILHPLITNYNPIHDIIYILLCFDKDKTNPNNNILIRDDIINHLLKYGYLKHDIFLLFLLSLGLNSSSKFLNEYFQKSDSYNLYYIDNFFIFASAENLDILSEQKIMPTLDRLMLCTSLNQLQMSAHSIMFLDNECEKYIKKISVCLQTECYIYKEEYYNEMFIDIYESLNDNDKKIILHIDKKNILKISIIIRYGIKLTKKYITYMITCGCWIDIILLMHLSNKYDYILKFIDITMILLAPTLIARIWLLNNILNSNRKSFINFYCPYVTFENNWKYYQQFQQIQQKNDIIKLLSTPLINNIDDIKEEIKVYKENKHKNIILDYYDTT